MAQTIVVAGSLYLAGAALGRLERESASGASARE
jgi:hypothetical protein